MQPFRIPLAREGWAFLLPAAFLVLLSWVIGLWPGSIFFLAVSLSFAFFFRDPEREIPSGDHLLLSPADGKIMGIKKDDSRATVSIFLSLLDVHLVRSPISGVVVKMEEKRGKTLPAYRPEASSRNRAKTLIIQNKKETVELKMIVGVAARRIRCYVRPGESVSRGQRIGLMVFGSRVEISFPLVYSLRVTLNQRVKGGGTVLAERKTDEE